MRGVVYRLLVRCCENEHACEENFKINEGGQRGLSSLRLSCAQASLFAVMSTKTNQPRFPAQDMTVFGSGEHKLSWSSKQQEGSKADFLWSDLPEPHAERKKIIVDEFKEKVSSLNGPTWKTKYVVLFTVSLHLTFAYLLRDMAWTTWEFWLVSFNATVQCDGSCLVVGKRSVCLGPTCYLRQCVLPF